MLKMNKFFLLFFVLVISSSFVSAAPIFEDDFNRSDSGTVGNGWAETETGGGGWSILTERLKGVDTNSGYLRLDQSISTGTSYYKVESNPDQTTGRMDFQLLTGSTVVISVRFNEDGKVYVNEGGSQVDTGETYTASNTKIEAKNISHVSHTFDLYIDDVLINTYDFASNEANTNVIRFETATAPQGTFFIDDVCVGDESDCVEAVIPENSSNERTFIFEQIGSTTINSASFITIMNNTFDIPILGDAYFGYRLSVDSSTNTKMECQILIDGDDAESPINRSTSDSLGTMYVITQPVVNLSVGEHSSALQCKRLGGGNIQVSNIYGVGHYLVDENNQTINNNHIHLEDVTVNSDVFVSVGNLSLVASSTNFTTRTRSMVFNWAEELIYTENSEGITLIRVNGTNCSSYPRFGSAGVSGNIGGDCVINNVGSDENITFEILFKGNSTLAHFHGVIKEFVLEENELISGDLTGINIASSSLTKLINFSMVNDDHPSHGFFVKAGIPILSNEADTDSFFQFRLSGDDDQNGTIYEQLAQANNSVAITQYIFQNLSIGTYQVELWGSCANSNCTINGGDMVGYVTDTEEAIPLSFEVRAFDFFDDSSISNFSVAVEGGLTFSTTSGVVDVFHPEELGNLTITSGFNGGYFSLSVLNHNITDGLNVSLNQTLISWNCLEKISGDDLNCSQPVESTVFNYNIIGNPHTQSINVTDYFENLNTFNVTALQNETLNASMYSTNLNINSSSTLGTVTSCDYNVTGVTYTSYFEQVTGIPSSSVGLINGTYTVLADCDGYAFQTQTVIIENSTQNLSFVLLTTNSVNLTFFDTNTNTILNGTNVTVTFIGETSQTNVSDTGSLYVDLLNPSEYTILFSAAGYRQGSYIFTLDDRENINIPLYLEDENDTSLVLISVIDKFSKDPIQNAKVTIQKYKNDAWVTDQIVSTDFQGFTEAYFVLSTTFYNFLVEFEGTVFFGIINSNDNKKTIFAEDVANGISIEIDTSPFNNVPSYQTSYDIVTNLRYSNSTNSSGFFIFTFDDTNNLPREATLNVTNNEGEVVCTNSVTSESGNINCFVNVTLGDIEYFTGTGYILLGEDQVPVNSYTAMIGIDETLTFDWLSTGVGYILGFFVVLISFLIFAKIPAMSLMSGTLAFCALVVFRVMFRELNLGILIVFLFGAYLLSRIPSKSGVNA